MQKMKCGHKIGEVELAGSEITGFAELIRYVCTEGHVTNWIEVNANEYELDEWY